MQNRISFLCICFFLINWMQAQVSVGLSTGGIPTEVDVKVYQGGTCYSSDMQGQEGESSISINVDVVSGAQSAINYLLNGDAIDPADFISPTFKCSYYLLHVGGQVNSYLYTLTGQQTLEKEVKGTVSLNDVIQVYTPVATTLQVPVHASASVVSVQTFCDPANSEAVATAMVSVTLGSTTTTVSGTSMVSGSFLDNQYPDSTKYASVQVPAGVTTLSLSITGELMARSKVTGLFDNYPLACGSNAVASAGNSLTVGYFSGPNGQPLPVGTKITGLITGINYTDPQSGSSCLTPPTAVITPVNATCGQANGAATIVVNSGNTPSISWSNGQSGQSAGGLAVGQHFAVVEESNGCSAIFPFTIQDLSVPVLNLPETVTVLPGQSITLNASDTLGGMYSYLWSTGATTPTIQVVTPGEYKVTLTNSLGCSFTFSALVLDQEGFYISDGNIKTDFGLFFDDGGPNANYSDNQTAVITICPATPDKFIRLEFTEVDILNLNSQDELSVFDGKGSICPLSTNLLAPQIFTASSSSDGCLTVRFRATDYDGNGAGWRALIKTVNTAPAGCYIDTLSCGNTFTDPGGTNNNYAANDYKVYYICSGEANTNVQLSFSEVEMGLGDHLTIYDGKGVSCILEDSLVTSANFISSNQGMGCLTVVFDSDNTAQKKGWQATVNCLSSQVSPPEYCICGNNPAPSDSCDNAPILNNLEYFCGESSIYYDGHVTGDLETEFSCGVIHNNSFIKFVPSASTIKLGYKIKGGTHRLCDGIQLAVFRVSGNCEADNANWTQVNCLNIEDGLASAGTFEVNNLLVGQTYHLMVDGNYGSECLYTFLPLSGFATCPLNIGVEQVLCQPDGSYLIQIPIAGVANSINYAVQETQNFFETINDLTYKDDGLSNSITLGPYPAGWPYQVHIQGGQGLSACNLTVQGEPTCVIPCDLDVELLPFCEAGKITVFGKINHGTLPLSIHSDVFTKVIFPSDTNVFQIDLPSNYQPSTIPVYMADFNYCKQEQELTLPTCLTCSDALRLWPNPTGDRLYISTFDCLIWETILYDCNGRIVATPALEYNAAQQAFEIDLYDFPNGVYFLRLKNNETYLTEKIIKIR